MPTFRVEQEEDLAELHEVEKMDQTAGAQIFDKHHELAREELIDIIKGLAADPKTTDAVLRFKIGVLMGFDNLRLLKEEMIERLKTHRAAQREKEFEQELNIPGGEEIL